MEIYQEDQLFENIEFCEKDVFKHEFVNCIFNKCNFSKSNLRDTDFVDCKFSACDFSLAKLNNTGFKNAEFINCKLVGVDFSTCNDFLFSVLFSDCILDYSSFFKKKLKKGKFSNCSLKEVDFSEGDFTKSVFSNCDLKGATFLRSVLEGVDFRSSRNYSFDPELNKIKKAKFSHLGALGLLAKYDIEIVID